MLKVNYDVLKEKTNNYDSLSIGDKYSLGSKVYNLMATADKDKINSILEQVGLKRLFKNATETVLINVKKGMTIVPESNQRQMTLIFPKETQDASSAYFEIVDLAEKMGKDNLEKLVIVGFFMSEENMEIIQAYNLLSPEVSEILNG